MNAYSIHSAKRRNDANAIDALVHEVDAKLTRLRQLGKKWTRVRTCLARAQTRPNPYLSKKGVVS